MTLPFPFYEEQSTANVPQLECLLHRVMAVLKKLFAAIHGGEHSLTQVFLYPGQSTSFLGLLTELV